MTGTRRASYPRALVHDRSLSRNNRDKSLPKGGSGRHNWGSIEDEPKLEAGTEYGEEIEIEVEEGPQVQNHWTDDAGLTPVDEERQRTRRVATQADAQVTLADTAKTSKAAQLGKPQDTVPIGSGDDTAVDPTFEHI